MLSTLIAITMLMATKHRAVLPPPHVDFYVATNGSDSFSGTLSNSNSRGTDGPFASLDRARRAVASLRASQPSRTSPVVVMVRGGVYSLTSTFGLAAGDSGTAQSPTIYENFPGETPVFSGGVRVTGWTNAGGNLWKATLSAQTAAFENLFYNGVRRLRPRLGGLLGTFYRIGSTVYLTG